ncbi:hypothetical protein LEMLEM_LOCUS20535 [Lemmus lemmus]
MNGSMSREGNQPGKTEDASCKVPAVNIRKTETDRVTPKLYDSVLARSSTALSICVYTTVMTVYDSHKRTTPDGNV